MGSTVEDGVWGSRDVPKVKKEGMGEKNGLIMWGGR